MKDKIIEIFNSVGIKNIGFCSFDILKPHLLDCRAKARIPQSARTVIICAFPYKIKDEAPKNISRYAAVPDYHPICERYLTLAQNKLKKQFPKSQFEIFVDNSPIPEVSAAAAAGLGVRGDNGLLITEKYGSFVFLGEVVTDLYIECENNYRECESCGLCTAACPVGLKKQSCLSALSQKKGELQPFEKERLCENKIIWGCDKCADVCPANAKAENTYIKEFIDFYRNEYTYGEDISDRAYAWRGEKVIKRNYELIGDDKKL